MKPLFLLVACLLCPGGRMPGQTDQSLVDCKGGKVAVFGGTISADGRYAMAWTVRPRHPSAKAVDWTSYEPETGFEWINNYPFFDKRFPQGEFDLKDGVVDLQAKKFLPLDSDDPACPYFSHRDVSAAWSGTVRGKRYALLTNNARWSTVNVWLVSLSGTEICATDLRPAVDAAVRRFVSRQENHESLGFVVNFAANVPGPLFGRRTLKVPFDAFVPRSVEPPQFSGHVRVALPSGKIIGVDGEDKS